MTAPRDAAGDFRPPRYRLRSVPAADVVAGDAVSWNRRGRAEVCRVVEVERWPLAVCLLLETGDGLEAAHAQNGATVNVVEANW